MFSKKLTINVSVTLLLCLMVSNSYAEGIAAEREKQIRSQERIIENNIKSEIFRIGDGAKLEDYIKTGLKNNPGLKAAFYEWKSSFAKISQAFSLPDPQFTYTDYVTQKRAYAINQTFPLPDKLWIRESKAFKASEVVFYNFNRRRLELINKITNAYYEYAYLNKAILLIKENIKLLMNFESVAQAKYKSGLVQNQDLLKVQVELGKLKNELLSLEDLRLPLVAHLNALLYLPNNIMLPWPDEILEDVIMEHRYEEITELYKELTKNNPELLSLIEDVEKNKDALELARRDYFPDLTVGVTTIGTGDALMLDMVMFSINVPIWFNRLNAGVQEAEASLKAVKSLLENKKSDLLSQLALVHYKLRDALRQSYLYKDALLPKATQALNVTQSEYEGGKTDFLSLIDTERVLLDFQLAYYRQNTNFYLHLAELKSLTGELQTDAAWERLVNP